MKKDILTERSYFWRKKIKSSRRNLGCKFVRINTNNDLDYEFGNIYAFIDEFKNKKIKELEKEIR